MFDSNSNPFCGEFRINNVTARDQRTSDVVALSAGGFLVTWQSLGQDGSGNGIYARRYQATGDAQGDEFRVNSYTRGGQLRPQAVSLTTVGFAIFWTSDGHDGSPYDISGRFYAGNGRSQIAEFRVNTKTGDAQTQPNEPPYDVLSASSLPSKGTVVTWGSFDGSTQWNVRSQRLAVDR